MKFSRSNLVEVSKSSSDSDDNKFDTLKLLEDKNGIVKAGAEMKVRRALKHYTKNAMD